MKADNVDPNIYF